MCAGQHGTALSPESGTKVALPAASTTGRRTSAVRQRRRTGTALARLARARGGADSGAGASSHNPMQAIVGPRHAGKLSGRTHLRGGLRSTHPGRPSWWQPSVPAAMAGPARIGKPPPSIRFCGARLHERTRSRRADKEGLRASATAVPATPCDWSRLGCVSASTAVGVPRCRRWSSTWRARARCN